VLRGKVCFIKRKLSRVLSPPHVTPAQLVSQSCLLAPIFPEGVRIYAKRPVALSWERWKGGEFCKGQLPW